MDRKIRRIEVKLKSENLKPLSGWQLQEFINNINKGYSKIDLINEVSKLINGGEKAENIIIMNKSYEINNSYAYLKKSNEIDLNKITMVEKFYNLGRPISMYPNEKIRKIEIIFNLYEKIFSLFRTNKITTISKKKLSNYINLTFEEAIIFIEKDAMQIINTLESVNKESFKRLGEELSKYIKEAKTKYDSYIKDKSQIENFSKLVDIEFNNLKEEDKKKFISMEQKYFNKFFKYFRSIDRPIILRYDEINNKLIVIKKEYILNDVENENFLDYKDYSHNSPFIVTIIAGVAIASIVYLLYKGAQQEKLNIQEDEENKLLEEEANDEIRDIVKELANSKELNQVNYIHNNFLKNKLLDLKDRVEKSTNVTLKQKGVINNNMIIRLEDYKNNKELDKDDSNSSK